VGCVKLNTIQPILTPLNNAELFRLIREKNPFKAQKAERVKLFKSSIVLQIKILTPNLLAIILVILCFNSGILMLDNGIRECTLIKLWLSFLKLTHIEHSASSNCPMVTTV
jgi:hypothetical protein